MGATQSRGGTGWRAVYAMGRRRSVVVRAKATTGGEAMQEKEMTQEELIRRQRELINRLDKELREDAAEIATLRKTISEQAATIERLRSKAELFDELTRAR
jgi:predicted RNase H-like nuclease (RuvC/YqgF family)